MRRGESRIGSVAITSRNAGAWLLFRHGHDMQRLLARITKMLRLTEAEHFAEFRSVDPAYYWLFCGVVVVVVVVLPSGAVVVVPAALS